MSARGVLMGVGAGLIVVPVLLWSILPSTAHSFSDTVGTLVLLIVISPPLFITGLALVLVGAFRRGGGQQQQQQVVVVTGTALPTLAGRPCRSCRGVLASGARFCTACGQAA